MGQRGQTVCHSEAAGFVIAVIMPNCNAACERRQDRCAVMEAVGAEMPRAPHVHWSAEARNLYCLIVIVRLIRHAN